MKSRHHVRTSMLVPGLACALLAASPCAGQESTALYPASELGRMSRVYGPNLQGLWDEDFLPHVTPDERRRAGAVSLRLPLVGIRRSPLEFYSDAEGHDVYLPISSVKFVDDMSVAFAHYERRGCDKGVVSDYVAALRMQGDRIGGSPLEALGIPDDALEDHYVDDVSQKLLKSTIFFIAVHEYAHVMYQHRGYSDITAEQAQQQETAADLYALEVMRRIAVPPIGLAYLFLIMSRLERSPGDFDSTEEYEDYLRQEATHPVSSLRLTKVADAIEEHTEAFSRTQPDPSSARSTLEWLVPQLRQIADTLDDRQIRRLLADRGRSADVAAFRTACAR